ncbi:hypothetical protein A0H76_1493 [Hepatospora eriocheir]|uniref:Uncharacterized protein n=1 Tax=Hepatospora eriocheir TaxID=1081669 RepID=A0A1X0QGZ0_9MICR|nr:hypothetical protein A0H76_1493 [Hepatospora eriocheir]
MILNHFKTIKLAKGHVPIKYTYQCNKNNEFLLCFKNISRVLHIIKLFINKDDYLKIFLKHIY